MIYSIGKGFERLPVDLGPLIERDRQAPPAIARLVDEVLLRRVCRWPCAGWEEDDCGCGELDRLGLWRYSNFAERSYQGPPTWVTRPDLLNPIRRVELALDRLESSR